MRASKTSVFVRSCVVIFAIYLPMSWLWNAATGTNFWKPWEIAIAAVLSVLFYGGLAWILTNIGMSLLFGRNAEYQSYRHSGGDPFFDSLPRVFNPAAQKVSQTGQAEPDTEFVPPSSWTFVCPVCAARQPSRVCVCWNCHYGSDGDSTAYLERYGDVKPSDMTDQQWVEALRR